MIETESVGKTLLVKEVAVYPQQGGKFAESVQNVKAMLSIRDEVISQARARGFNRIVGEFHFTKNGKVIKFDYQLK